MTAPKVDPSRWLDEHGDALFAFAMLRINNRATAEDLVQETLIAGMQANFKGQSSERTWLIGILKNKIVDFIRKHHREVTADFGPDMPEFDQAFDETGHWRAQLGAWAEPARDAENDALKVALAECIAALPDRMRTLFVLREVDGLDTEWLVKELDLSSKNNLWVILSRARERLRSCLQASWFDGRDPKLAE